ncbi:type III restriction endonuclease subunit R [Spirochaetia bacterium]|nr:type III restriction endonuclease subunit R [Spirochaetia bacterium]
MTNKTVNTISAHLNLRPPQHDSLAILSRIGDILHLSKDEDVDNALKIVSSEYKTVTGFEHDFPSLCFAIATGVGKTRLMGAFISYLHIEKHINNFFVLAPNLTIYRKLIDDFTPNTPKYVFTGIDAFAVNPPLLITGDNYEHEALQNNNMFGSIVINIFNVSKINSEVRGGKSPRIKRLSEYIGQSYFEYLSKLDDLCLLMDESHRYRASAGKKAINELKPVLGFELTATPFVENAKGGSAKGVSFFKNIIYNYPLAKAMEDGFVKEPCVVTQKNFNPASFTAEQLEDIKLEDGIRLHENTKVELETYSRQNGKKLVKPFVLIIAKDTTHAQSIQTKIESDDFFDGAYKGKVIQVHSAQTGEEKEENIERLLAVEKCDEPTEIVIHVNMLKEGWDVTNLYTIIPLRAANARNLVEQSIGRGLRLPYGKRTGITALDRLSIVSHDHFQEIVDEARRSDSSFHISTMEIDPKTDLQKTKTIVTQSNIAARINLAADNTNKIKPLFEKPQEQKFAEIVYQVINEHEELPSTEYLFEDDTFNGIVCEAEAIYDAENSGDLPGIIEPIGKTIESKIVAKTVVTELVKNTIDIPKIHLVPKLDAQNPQGKIANFSLDCSAINFRPVENDLLVQRLRTGEQETISFAKHHDDTASFEDMLVSSLILFDDVSYEETAELLYDLSSQAVKHIRAYLKDENDIKNVIQYYQSNIAEIIHSQLLKKQKETPVEYATKITRGWTELKPLSFTTNENAEYMNYKRTDFDKQKIGKIIFNGFEKCLYPTTKFDSDTERRFSVIIERDTLRWFRPANGQFQISYTLDGNIFDYNPDFVAETNDCIYMIETKASNELASPVVSAKKDAAKKWCELASEYNKTIAKKPWKYMLVSHDEVQENRGLSSFE